MYYTIQSTYQFCNSFKPFNKMLVKVFLHKKAAHLFQNKGKRKVFLLRKVCKLSLKKSIQSLKVGD